MKLHVKSQYILAPLVNLSASRGPKIYYQIGKLMKL